MAYTSLCAVMQLSELSVCLPVLCLFVCLFGVRKSPMGKGGVVCGMSVCTEKTGVTSILLSYKFRRTLTNHQSINMETATA